MTFIGLERQIKLLEEHGADMVAHWQRLDNPNTVVWLLLRNRAHRDEFLRILG